MAQYLANPIYDSAFKYMMQNEKSATLLLSALLQRKIIDLKIIANDTPVIEEKSGVRILRLDFAATVVNPVTNENELITIELQKSYLDTEIMRFRTYLANKYSDPNNAETLIVKSWRKNPETKQFEYVNVEKKKPLHIVAIYILGHTFQEIEIKKPVIYNYANPTGIENEPVSDALKSHFFRSLTYDTIIVQIPYLKKNAQSKVEQMLEAFCQDYISTKSNQLLEMDISSKPQEFQDLIRPLIYAVADSDVRKVMDIEDEMSAYFANYKSVTDEIEVLKEMTEETKKELQESKKELQKTTSQLQESKKELQETTSQLQESKIQLQEKDSQLLEKDSQLQKQSAQIIKSIQKMYSHGMKIEEIAETFETDVKFVEEVVRTKNF